MMLDHVGFPVSDFDRSQEFYDAVMPAIGARRMMNVTAEMTGGSRHAGYGVDKPDFWIGTGAALTGVLHLAFCAASRTEVDAFYAAAMAAGAKDNGAPGLRPQYHPDYYGAFVFDPDGHNVEAVCHRPE
jgi:catechol 2,3-dioxygenase-like lactoylglutathione lyase family enzyme